MIALSSCVEEAIGDLTGKFPAPTEVTLNTLNSSTVTKDETGKRQFVLDITDGTNVLHATLVGNKYYLSKNTYTEAAEAVAEGIVGAAADEVKAITAAWMAGKYVNYAVDEEGVAICLLSTDKSTGIKGFVVDADRKSVV